QACLLQQARHGSARQHGGQHRAASGAEVKAAIALLVLLALPALASAQPYIGSNGPQKGNVEFSGAAAWTGGYDAGDAAALETRNTTNGSSPLKLVHIHRDS